MPLSSQSLVGFLSFPLYALVSNTLHSSRHSAHTRSYHRLRPSLLVHLFSVPASSLLRAIESTSIQPSIETRFPLCILKFPRSKARKKDIVCFLEALLVGHLTPCIAAKPCKYFQASTCPLSAEECDFLHVLISNPQPQVPQHATTLLTSGDRYLYHHAVAEEIYQTRSATGASTVLSHGIAWCFHQLTNFWVCHDQALQDLVLTVNLTPPHLEIVMDMFPLQGTNPAITSASIRHPWINRTEYLNNVSTGHPLLLVCVAHTACCTFVAR